MHRYVSSGAEAMNRRVAFLRRGAVNTATRQAIPDNSVSWLTYKPETLGDVFYISDQIRSVAARWGRTLKHS